MLGLRDLRRLRGLLGSAHAITFEVSAQLLFAIFPRGKSIWKAVTSELVKSSRRLEMNTPRVWFIVAGAEERAVR